MVSRFSLSTLTATLAALILCSAPFAYAATSTVTNAQPFAWSNNSGWVNWENQIGGLENADRSGFEGQ